MFLYFYWISKIDIFRKIVINFTFAIYKKNFGKIHCLVITFKGRLRHLK